MNIWSAFVGLLEQLLLFFSSLTGNMALGIVLFTIAARLVILPLTITSLRSSRRMQEVQPILKEIQRKYGKDPQRLQEETLRVYREHKINPVGGCLPLLLQLPIFFGVYQAVYHLMVPEQRIYLSAGAAEMLQDDRLAQILAAPFFGMDLGMPAFGANGFAGLPYLILPILSIVLQLVQQLMATPRVMDPQQKAFMQAMLIMPFVFGYIAFTFPTGAVLYWVVSSVVGVIQQYFTSGWGSLANYLRFLPPDNRPAPTLALASSTAGSGSTSEPQPETPKVDFRSVLQPLIDAPVESGQSHGTEQRPNRQQPNPRRRR